MPIIMEVFHPDRLVIGVGRGEVTMVEYGKFLGDIIQGGMLHYRKIIDVTGVTSSNVGKDELLAFDERFKGYSRERRGPLAIVADPYRHEVADAFQALTSKDRPVEVFRSVRDARKWLLTMAVGGTSPGPAAKP
jgi:hypothetical protein